MNRSSAHRWASRPFLLAHPCSVPESSTSFHSSARPLGRGGDASSGRPGCRSAVGSSADSVRQMAGLLMVANPSPDPRATLLVTREGPGFDLDHVDHLSQRRSPCRARRGPPARGHTVITDACGLPRPDLPWNGDLPAGINLLPGLLRTVCTQPDWAGGSSSPPPRARRSITGAERRARAEAPAPWHTSRRGEVVGRPPPDSCRAVSRYHVPAIRRSRSHRLVAKDTTLSRWRHGFESRWDCQISILHELLVVGVQTCPMTIENGENS